jgi:hypothetical protein
VLRQSEGFEAQVVRQYVVRFDRQRGEGQTWTIDEKDKTESAWTSTEDVENVTTENQKICHSIETTTTVQYRNY